MNASTKPHEVQKEEEHNTDNGIQIQNKNTTATIRKGGAKFKKSFMVVIAILLIALLSFINETWLLNSFNFGVVNEDSELLLSTPFLTHNTLVKNTNDVGQLTITTMFSSSLWPSASTASSSPFDPRGKPLPSHTAGSVHIELMDLVGSNRPYSCPPGLVFVRDHILPDSITHPQNADGTPSRLMPNLFHITAKSRCMTPAFANNVELWKNRLGRRYSIYIHDDAAMDKLLYEKQWNEFPELKEVLGCVTSGAGKADIWRYLLIWEYGGIYSDMDSSPNKINANSISPQDDAWFPLEALGIPSQYFFAASPRHPVMFFSAIHALERTAFQYDISENNAAATTGPGAFKTGFILFQRMKGIDTNGYVSEGVYVGAHDRSVRVVGSKEIPSEWIIRFGVKSKDAGYAEMNMTHFHRTGDKFKLQHGQSRGCLEQRWGMHNGAYGWNMIV